MARSVTDPAESASLTPASGLGPEAAPTRNGAGFLWESQRNPAPFARDERSAAGRDGLCAVLPHQRHLGGHRAGLPMHGPGTNVLTFQSVDPYSRQPSSKYGAVGVRLPLFPVPVSHSHHF